MLYRISNFVTSTDIDYVDLTQPADTITSAQTLLHRQKDAAKDFGLYGSVLINKAPHKRFWINQSRQLTILYMREVKLTEKDAKIRYLLVVFFCFGRRRFIHLKK